MAKNAKKIAVKSETKVAKVTYPKVTKKTIRSALRSEVDQNNQRVFAFPTAAGVAAELAVVDRVICEVQGRDEVKHTSPKKANASAAKAAKKMRKANPDRPNRLKALFATGDRVSHPAHGIGVVYQETNTPGVYEVDFDNLFPEVDNPEVTEVHQDECTLIQTAKEITKAGRKPDVVASKVQCTKFENLSLLCGFVKADDKGQTYVKVGNTSAICVDVKFETNGGAGAHLPFVHLNLFGMDLTANKIRLKKATLVTPIDARPFEV